MDEKDKDLLESSNPLYAKKKQDKVVLTTIFEWTLLECLSLSLNKDGLEALVVWEFADQYKLDRLWLWKWLKISYGTYMEMELKRGK